jgi:hypothetical protein
MFRKVFSPRNFLVQGMNHQAMRVDYYYHLLKRLRPDVVAPALRRDVKGVVAELNQNNAALLDAICDVVESAPTASEVAARTDELSQAREAFDEVLRPRVDALLTHMEELSEVPRARPRPRMRRAASVVAVGLAASALGCPKQDTHMAEMAPEEPCMGRGSDAAAEGVIHARIQERYLPGLLSFARARGIHGAELQLELELVPGGTIVLSQYRTFPAAEGLQEGLAEIVSTWRHELALECQTHVTVQLQLVRPGERPPDTHMAEMAPPDPEPPPPPASSYDGDQIMRLQQAIQRRFRSELVQLGVSNGMTPHRHVTVTVRVSPDGDIVEAHLNSPWGANPRLTAQIAELLTSWRASGFPAGEAKVVLSLGRVPPRKQKPPDTHMAEMAPRDPEDY